MFNAVSVTMELWQVILIIILLILVTAVATFFIARKVFTNQLEKNPPINEQVIRTMMAQMGRTPSEKQVKAVMNSMNPNNKDKEVKSVTKKDKKKK